MRSDRGRSWPRLGRREEQVLTLKKQGLPNPHIAKRLGIRPPTVRSYLFRLRRKFGVENDLQLGEAMAEYERELGPLDPEGERRE
jgi:DNA-binding NarL/FixJ family response regulator